MALDDRCWTTHIHSYTNVHKLRTWTEAHKNEHTHRIEDIYIQFTYNLHAIDNYVIILQNELKCTLSHQDKLMEYTNPDPNP